MTIIRVAPELVSEMLFEGHDYHVEISGCTFDPVRKVIEFEISGAGIPDAPEVTAIVSQARRTVAFRAVEGVQS